MNRIGGTDVGLVVALLAVVAGYQTMAMRTAGQARQPTAVPAFEYDADWPKPLPNNWVTGNIGAMAVDSNDHVWVAQRPSGTTALGERYGLDGLGDCCIPAWEARIRPHKS